MHFNDKLDPSFYTFITKTHTHSQCPTFSFLLLLTVKAAFLHLCVTGSSDEKKRPHLMVTFQAKDTLLAMTYVFQPAPQSRQRRQQDTAFKRSVYDVTVGQTSAKENGS